MWGWFCFKEKGEKWKKKQLVPLFKDLRGKLTPIGKQIQSTHPWYRALFRKLMFMEHILWSIFYGAYFMECIFPSACLYRWDLPLSEFWVCDPALKGGCCFLQKHWVFVPGSSSQVLQVGRSVEGRKLLPGEGFPSGQEGFMKMKSVRQAGGIEDCHPSRSYQR